MIETTRKFLINFVSEHTEITGKVLEVGSLDVNGNIRDSLTRFEYTGIDMREGPNVDVVVNGHDLVKKFGENSFDLVICFDTLEHDDRPWLTVKEMRRVLKSNGWLLLAAPSLHMPRHNHPNDYYRFLGPAFHIFFEGFNNVHVHEEFYFQQDDRIPDEVLGFGQKP